MEFGDVWDFRGESHVTEYMTRLATKDKHKNRPLLKIKTPKREGS
jgi:hypothetical protein